MRFRGGKRVNKDFNIGKVSSKGAIYFLGFIHVHQNGAPEERHIYRNLHQFNNRAPEERHIL